jgi:hypothetical protein
MDIEAQSQGDSICANWVTFLDKVSWMEIYKEIRFSRRIVFAPREAPPQGARGLACLS